MPKVVAGYRDQARLRISDAARVVFQRKGFTHATMDDVAKEVGVSKGALYLYFRTKAELLVHVHDRTRNEILRSWERLLEEGDVAEGIARSMDAIFSGEVDPALWFHLVADSANDPGVRAALELDRQSDTKAMRRFLRLLEDRGRIPKMDDPEAAAEAILMMLRGAAAQVIWQHSGDSRKRLVRALRLVLGT
jgi:TetR/AcrR family transcriptional repressor of uid operon